MRSLTHDSFCFACGKDNPQGLKLKYTSIEKGKVKTTFTPLPNHQSYDDTFHGGIQALLLDACMVQAVKTIGIEAVTGKMDIRYKEKTELKAPLEVSAEVVKERGRYFVVKSSIVQDSVLRTTASAIYKKRESTSMEN